MDIRRYISESARPGQELTLKIAGGIEVARGKWLVVEPNQVRAEMTGTVPWFIPKFAGKEFSVILTTTLMNDGHRARVEVQGSTSGSAEGRVVTHNNELKVQDLKFDAPLDTISEVAFERWSGTETKFSFYRAPYTFFWFSAWMVPRGTESTGDYPPPALHEGAQR